MSANETGMCPCERLLSRQDRFLAKGLCFYANAASYSGLFCWTTVEQLRRFLLLAFFLLAHFLSYPSALASGSFSVSGVITESRLWGPPESFRYKYVCTVHGEKWQIRLARMDPEKRIRFGHGEIVLNSAEGILSSDGARFFQVRSDPDRSNGPSMDMQADTSRLPVISSAIMGPWHAPFGPINEPFLVVWYSYASSEFLRNRTNGTLLSLRGLDFETVSAHGRFTPAQWELLDGSPGLPQWIQTSNHFAFSNEAAAATIRNGNLPHTNVTFQVLEVARVAGATVPMHVQVDYFFHRVHDGRLRREHHARIELKAADITAETPSKDLDFYVPRISGIAMVHDLSFWLLDDPVPVGVVVTNHWPSEAAVLARYGALREKSQQNRVPAGSPWLLLFVVLLLGTLPILLVFRAKRCTRRTAVMN